MRTYSMCQKNVSNTIQFCFIIFSQKLNGYRAQRRSTYVIMLDVHVVAIAIVVTLYIRVNASS